ncbi:hypothetical protein [Glycomyces paridis]|uniref:YokE-like PH domain-containing protein n=1 Tax=Glycomyces paridis TaxID=2126555 RepID=A0A4S8PF21_9ACTN|nr:hypothetical protein [Glycomyces paridis]THV28451.1 hypothetical protein E9998_12690 [Glycomyces paridis]
MDEQQLLADLTPHLMPDERVDTHVRGSYLVGIFTNTGPRKGILVATTHRMLFYGQSVLNGQTLDVHAYATMGAFEALSQIGTRHFKWLTAGRRYHLRYASGNVDHFARVVHPRVGQAPPGAAAGAVAVPTLDQQIANLVGLRDRGALSADQYEAALARLIGS